MDNLLYILIALVLAPLFPGVVNQTKAFFAGRRGPGFFRLYFDLAKLLRKSCPRSTTSTWLFDLAPAASLAATLAATLVFPWSLTANHQPPTSTSPVLFFYLLGTGRFFTVLGALDTGSAFEGMGASREVQFSALVEPAVFVVLGLLTMITGGIDLSAVLSGSPRHPWSSYAVPLLLAGIAFFAILLSECCRVPFDDPETHLELTMIHEAMILDNAGPDLAFIHYGAAVKFELLAAFLVAMLLPRLQWHDAASITVPWPPALCFATLTAGVAVTAVLVGIVESCMARMRFLKTPQILMAAMMLAALGPLIFIMF